MYMECEESHLTEVKCNNNTGNPRLRRSQSDNILRCPNHYRLKAFGFCTENHQDPVLAVGHHKMCGKCRYRKNARSTTRNVNLIGLKNEHGLEYISGPFKQYGKNKNATAWGLMCPFCEQEFIGVAAQIKEAKSCYPCRGELLKVSSAESTLAHLYSGIKGRKAAKYLGFDITIEQFSELVQMDCDYCGSPPAVSKGHRSWSVYVRVNGIDRIDSSKGYVQGNVIPCCRRCNTAKLDSSREEFLAWAHQLVQHQQNK